MDISTSFWDKLLLFCPDLHDVSLTFVRATNRVEDSPKQLVKGRIFNVKRDRLLERNACILQASFVDLQFKPQLGGKVL